jgi:succinyl-diaminopimelate desuccinylase
VIAAAAKPFRGIKVETTRVLSALPLAPQPGWQRISDALRRHAARILKTRIPVKGVPLYTDARHYAARNIPIVLYGAGPRTILEANAHNANENLRLADLRAATKVVALAVRDVLRSSPLPQGEVEVTASQRARASDPPLRAGRRG